LSLPRVCGAASHFAWSAPRFASDLFFHNAWVIPTLPHPHPCGFLGYCYPLTDFDSSLISRPWMGVRMLLTTVSFWSDWVSFFLQSLYTHLPPLLFFSHSLLLPIRFGFMAPLRRCSHFFFPLSPARCRTFKVGFQHASMANFFASVFARLHQVLGITPVFLLIPRQPGFQ